MNISQSIPHFLKFEIPILLVALCAYSDKSTNVNITKNLNASWPIPKDWNESERHQFFELFNGYYTLMDEQATARGLPLFSRAVSIKNVAMFMASSYMTELEQDMELLESLASLTSFDLVDPNNTDKLTPPKSSSPEGNNPKI